MPKAATTFFCKDCGHETAKWLGKCPSCDAWDTFVEEKTMQSSSKVIRPNVVTLEKPQSITKVSFKEDNRIASGISELDRVLGGGVVHGSVILIAGEPGIGKSTLMLQVAHRIAKVGKVLYVTGEESAAQIKMRAQRLGALTDDLMVYPETSVFAVEKAVDDLKCKVWLNTE